MTDRHDRMLQCRNRVLEALVDAQALRASDSGLEWIDRERQVVTDAANQWAASTGDSHTLTIDEVTRLEGMAAGHFDYSSKFALYVAERVVYGKAGRP